MSLLLAAVQILGRMASLRERPLFILSAVVVILYGALAEGTAPVIRSSLMGLISAYSPDGPATVHGLPRPGSGSHSHAVI